MNFKIFFSCALFLTVIFVFCHAQESSKPYGNCKIPKKVADFEWNNTGVEEGGLYLPLGAKSDYKLVKEMLFGTDFNPDEDLVKLCARMKWKGLDVFISNNLNNTVPFKCENIGGKSWILECKRVKKEGEPEGTNFNHRAYITLTDKKKFIFVVRCWENGNQGWGVFSTKKALQGDTEIQILEHARSLGYETAEALPLSYKKCGPTIVKTKS